MTFSKIAFAVATIAAENVGDASFHPGDACKPSTTNPPTNPCTSEGARTGMSCVIDKVDKKTQKPISGTCECPKDGEGKLQKFANGRCQSAHEEKEGKCMADANCHWDGDTDKCVMKQGLSLNCAHDFEPANLPPNAQDWEKHSCYNNGDKKCIHYDNTVGGPAECKRTIPVDDKCSKYNTGDNANVVMV